MTFDEKASQEERPDITARPLFLGSFFASVFFLFHRNGFCQIPGLIYV